MNARSKITLQRVALAVFWMLLLSARITSAANPTPMMGSARVGAGIPTGSSPDRNGNKLSIDVFHYDANGNLAKTTVPVPDVPVCQGLPNPTPAQVAAASAAKAAAIASAINNANLPGVTASVNPQTTPGGSYPTGNVVQRPVYNRFGQQIGTVPVAEHAPANFSSLTINGVRQSILDPNTPSARLGPAVVRTPGNRVTGELGDADYRFTPGGSGSGGAFQGAMNGSPGNGPRFSSGIDDSGNPSLVGFGLVDTSGPTPVAYLESFRPEVGMSEETALTYLGSLFNEDYASAGYTTTYDPASNTLSIDQLLPETTYIWSSDSDTMLDLNAVLSDSPATAVPEPATVTALLTIAGCQFLSRKRFRGGGR